MAEAGILTGDVLPHLPAVADGGIKAGGGVMIADGGVGAVGAVGEEHEGVLVDVHGLRLALFKILYLCGDLAGMVDVENNIGAGGAEHELHAVTAQVLYHREDHGLILVVLRELQRLERGQTADMVDEAVDVLLDFERAVLILESEHRAPVGPEVGVEHLVGPYLVDGLAVKVFVFHKEELHYLHAGGVGQAELAVGMGVLAALLGHTAERIVGVMLVEPVVFIQNGHALRLDRGDASEQIPKAFKVVLHLAAAADDKALVDVQDTVAGAAGYGHILHDGDVLAGHLGVADEEAGRRKTGKAAADYHGVLLFNSFGFLGARECFVVAVAVIHDCSSQNLILCVFIAVQ